jgi:hypothetical protein
MLTPGMLDILTQFVAEYSPAEFHADILETLTAIPPLPSLQDWLVVLELECRLNGMRHGETADQLAGYIEGLRLAHFEESPYVCRAHVDQGLMALEIHRCLRQAVRLDTATPRLN